MCRSRGHLIDLKVRSSACCPPGGPLANVVPVTRRWPLTHTGMNLAAPAGEMRVNNGGDPGRDDYGLPPVDIEVPDDARELDREVQAYHRELRSLRRRLLARKLYGPLTRDGMVLPLLAGCLALTLLAATLLTVFTVGQGTVGGPFSHPGFARSGAANPVAGGTGASLGPAAGQPGGRLPA